MDHPSCWPEFGGVSAMAVASAFFDIPSSPAGRGFAARAGTPALRAWRASLPVPGLHGFRRDSGLTVHEVAVCSSGVWSLTNRQLPLHFQACELCELSCLATQAVVAALLSGQKKRATDAATIVPKTEPRQPFVPTLSYSARPSCQELPESFPDTHQNESTQQQQAQAPASAAEVQDKPQAPDSLGTSAANSCAEVCRLQIGRLDRYTTFQSAGSLRHQ